MRGDDTTYWEIELKNGEILKDDKYKRIDTYDNYIYVYDLITHESKYTEGFLWWKHEVKDKHTLKDELMILNRDSVSKMIKHNKTRGMKEVT